MIILFSDGFDALEPDSPISSAPFTSPDDRSVRYETEDVVCTVEREGEMWVVTYAPTAGPTLTLRTGSRPTFIIQ